MPPWVYWPETFIRTVCRQLWEEWVGGLFHRSTAGWTLARIIGLLINIGLYYTLKKLEREDGFQAIPWTKHASAIAEGIIIFTFFAMTIVQVLDELHVEPVAAEEEYET